MNLFELKLVCAICNILFLNKNEMLQMGQHNKIVGYLVDIIQLRMGHMRYLWDISVTKWDIYVTYGT